MWACRVLTGDDLKRFKLFVCDIAERTLVHVPEGEHSLRVAIETARKYINGDATLDELYAARTGARTGARTAAAVDAAVAAAAVAVDAADVVAAAAVAVDAAVAADDVVAAAARAAAADAAVVNVVAAPGS